MTTDGVVSLEHATQRRVASISPPSQHNRALMDIIDGVKSWRIWLMLAYLDIKLRYQRSILGPLWITISMAITVYSMGFLYAHLFHAGITQYYPFLVAGMLTWGLISNLIIEQTDTFMASNSILMQAKLPYSLYIHRVSTRNFIVFFHNILVMVPIYFIFTSTAKINLNIFFLIPGLGLIYINSIIYGLIFAIIGTRYRDVSQIIKSLVQVIFFITPVMWDPSILPESKRVFVIINPIYSYLELIRAPLIGNAPTLLNFCIVLITTIIGTVFCARLFIQYRSRIIYWL